ncbi:MAG TPA: hypothetical protein VES40_10525, partial [Ilumatobacteraceae bacterium]|nr:hypothetical protein [Ilumatobacteraceae bacterium]
MLVAIGSDASVGGGGLLINQNAPTHTTTVASDAATRRPTPNHSIHARARSAYELAGLARGSTFDLLDRKMRTAQRHQEEVGTANLSLHRPDSTAASQP